MKINASRGEHHQPTQPRAEPFRSDEGSDADLDSERHRTAISGVGQRDLYGGGGWDSRRGVATVDVLGGAPDASTQRSRYESSDLWLFERVVEALGERRDIDSSEVEVNVRDGEVTLSGTVPEELMKYEAELVCTTIPGVVDVCNRLRVRAGEGAGRI